MRSAILALPLALCASLASAGDLEKVLKAQPEEVQARYEYRHPAETLKFFGIKPGMTVVEALPGRGWYTKILMPYLGSDGKVIGADYAPDMYAMFSFATPEMLEKKKSWTSDWTAEASTWGGEKGASAGAFVLGALPDAMKGSADAAIFIRAFHNLARFNDKGGYLDTAVANVYDILKPGGVLGVVQHEARPDRSDDWADGSSGYLKRDFLVKKLEAAGFELVGESDINANPKDQAREGDIVWRLPPTYATSRDNPELKEEMKAIGESNRMTLLFRKPA